MNIIIEYLSLFLIICGCFFMISGAIGCLKFNDFFVRLHAAGVCDIGGSLLIICGIIMQSGFNIFSFKLILLIFLLLLTSPTATQTLAQSAMAAKLIPKLKNKNALR